MIVKLYIGNESLDRFKDESIEINSSVLNISDIAKNTTDYSKSFTVPATHRNNKIFKHYYNPDIDNYFDARIKVSGRIELDGLPFKHGKWSLLKVNLKKGNPYSYTLNFYGNLVSIKDVLKNDELSDLDFSDLSFDYNSANVKLGLTGSGLFSGDIIYNTIAKRQWYYNSASSGTPTNILTNIAYGTSGTIGIKWNEIRPSIRLIKIIEAIENKYSITFSRDFFGKTEFTALYAWCNNDTDLLNVQNNSIQVDFDNYGTISTAELDLVNNYFIPKKSNTNFRTAQLRITPTAGYTSIKYNVEAYLDGNLIKSYKDLSGTKTCEIRTSVAGGKYSFKVMCDKEMKFTPRLKVFDRLLGIEIDPRTATFAEHTITTDFFISNCMPKMKIIDFINGLFKMFKLVVIADEYNNIYVDTLNNFYASGQVWNISRYIDRDSLEVSRGDLLNSIKFNFQEPSTILNKRFKSLNGIAYGDSETILTDDGTSTGNPIDGGTLEYSLPFEMMVYEKLFDLKDNSETPIVYGGSFDESISPANPKMHLFYNINQTLSSKTVAFINDAGAKEALTSLNMPSHSISVNDPDFTITFNPEFSEFTNIANEKTLYTNYHENYVLSVFNPKRRNYKYTLKNTPLRLILDLRLNDVLEIDNKYFRVDNFTTNLLNKEVVLSLVNSFDNTINAFTADRTVINTDYTAQEQSISITNLNNYSLDIDGGTWVTYYQVGSNIFFVLEENPDWQTRAILVTITNTDTLEIIEITINQFSRNITIDNSIITIDNNIITIDNSL